jgi:hypothetical protein
MRNLVWKSMLDADMNVRYWRYLTQRYVNRDQNIKIFLALTSSGTVASWSIWENGSYLWQILSAVSALIAIASPILNYQKVVEATCDLSGEWWELKRDYEMLWRRVEKGENGESVEKGLKNAEIKENDLVRKEARLAGNKRLLRKCQDEVLRSRGLTKKESEDE